jgi:outer membrane protein assembly factor BamB
MRRSLNATWLGAPPRVRHPVTDYDGGDDVSALHSFRGSLMTFSGLAMLAALAVGQECPGFRGVAGNGTASGGFPAEWSMDRNIAWKTPLGTGWAQPVVSGGRIFVTMAESDKAAKPKNFQGGVADPSSMGFFKPKAPDVTITWKLACLDLASGKVLWSKEVVQGKPKEPIHPSNSWATETPVIAGDRVIGLFGAAGVLAAWDRDGKELWRKDVGVFPMTVGFGTGSSPATDGELVFVQNHNETKSFLAAFKVNDGSEAWRIEGPKGSSWATPVVWRNRIRTELVSCGRGLVRGLDPKTGRELWKLGGIDSSFSSSPAVSESMLFVGNSGPGSSGPLYGIKAGATGDITLGKNETSNEFVAWKKTGAGPGMSSPIADNERLWVLSTRALTCYEAATGKELFKARVPGIATVAASGYLVGGKLFLLDETGKTFVLDGGSSFKLLGTNRLDDTMWATPAPAGDTLLIRGLDHLYAIRATPPKS